MKIYIFIKNFIFWKNQKFQMTTKGFQWKFSGFAFLININPPTKFHQNLRWFMLNPYKFSPFGIE